MIILEEKKSIPMNHMVHMMNHTQIVRCCMLNESHIDSIPEIVFNYGENLDYLPAGIYKTTLGDGLEYAFDLYYPLIDSPDHFVIKNDNIMNMVINSVNYPVIPYKIIPEKKIKTSAKLEHTINDNISMVMITGRTLCSGIPSLDNPVNINRMDNLSFSSYGLKYEKTLSFPLKYHLGKLPNGIHDTIVINAEQLVCHVIMRTAKEILTGGLDWKYIDKVSNEDYYVFFAEYSNIKCNNTSDGLRCSHFTPVDINTLLKLDDNCIAVSNEGTPNGIWVKIDTKVLDIHGNKDIGLEFKKWLAAKAISANPIYIEYETNNTKFHQILLDEYHIRLYYPETTILLENNYEFSIFYKGLI